MVLSFASRSTLAACSRVNTVWYHPSVKVLYDGDYELFPTIEGYAQPAYLTERKRYCLERTRHLTVRSHDTSHCHSEAPLYLPALETLQLSSKNFHDGEQPYRCRMCPLLRFLQPSQVTLHGMDFPPDSEVWPLLGGRDVVIVYDPTKNIPMFHRIDRWPSLANVEGAPRSLTVVFESQPGGLVTERQLNEANVRSSPFWTSLLQPDGVVAAEHMRDVNLKALATWAALLPAETPLTMVDLAAGATLEGVTMTSGMPTIAWEEGGREDYAQDLWIHFLLNVFIALEEAEETPEVVPFKINKEARVGNTHFLEAAEHAGAMTAMFKDIAKQRSS